MSDRVPHASSSRDITAIVKLHPGWVRKSTVWVLLMFALYQVANWVWGSLADFLFLLLLAWLLGIALDPLVTRLSARGLGRGISTLIVMLGLAVMTVIFFATFGSLLAAQVVSLAQEAPAIIARITDWLNQQFNLGLDPATITDQLNLGPQDIARVASNVAGGLLGFVSSVVGVIFDGFTMLLFTFYFAAEGPRLRRTLAGMMPAGQQKVFHDLWSISTEKAGGFVISRLGLAAVSAAFAGVFFLTIGLEYWLAMALWVGLISQFIPTIGTYLAILLPALIALGQSPLTAVGVVLFATIYQQVENYFFAPKISSKTMDIHPAVAFASVIIGAALFGPIGALIGIPLAATVIAFLQAYTKGYDVVNFEDAPDSEPQPA